MLSALIDLTERGLIPEKMIRFGIRRLCAARLNESEREEVLGTDPKTSYVEMLKKSPIAVFTQAANDQHYEVPPDFFQNILGPNLKYSCAYWDDETESLKKAEDKALQITMERAELSDGMKILELGCGWGSLTLAMARHYPNAQITAVSNSNGQRQFILDECKKRNLTNINVITENVALLDQVAQGPGYFDRVVSIEMFEHMRNYELLLQRIENWLAPDGKLFVHIFTHKKYSYLFETEGSDNWMGRYFFTGGQMPSKNLLAHFQDSLQIEKQWEWSGSHYQKTSEAWLQKFIENKDKVKELLIGIYGKNEAVRWYNRWKVFFLSVAELFGFADGTEWGVSHYLFSKRGAK